MKHFIEDFFTMDIASYKAYLEGLAPVNVKKIHDSCRVYVSRAMEYEGEVHEKCKAFRAVTKEVLDTKGHIPNKNERKESRKNKQLEKQNR